MTLLSLYNRESPCFHIVRVRCIDAFIICTKSVFLKSLYSTISLTSLGVVLNPLQHHPQPLSLDQRLLQRGPVLGDGPVVRPGGGEQPPAAELGSPMGRRSLLLHAALPDQAPPQVSALQAEVERLQSALAEREDELSILQEIHEDVDSKLAAEHESGAALRQELARASAEREAEIRSAAQSGAEAAQTASRNDADVLAGALADANAALEQKEAALKDTEARLKAMEASMQDDRTDFDQQLQAQVSETNELRDALNAATASTGPATPAAAAISRDFLLMVAPNKHVPHGRKLGALPEPEESRLPGRQ